VSALTTSDGRNAMICSMAAPLRRTPDRAVLPRDLYELPEERTSRRRLSTDVAVMASIATAVVGIAQWPLLLAADRAVHLLERLRRHPDSTE
jgi:hypothetical protein